MAAIHQLRPIPRVKAGSDYIDPATLHLQLAPTSTVAITFAKEKELQRYRRLIYSINRQGTYRYRTMHDEFSSHGLIIWRMK